MKVRWANMEFYDDVPNFKWDDFKAEAFFDEEIFGWYGTLYIAVKTIDYNKRDES